jgi:hypothetical protein
MDMARKTESMNLTDHRIISNITISEGEYRYWRMDKRYVKKQNHVESGPTKYNTFAVE